MFKKLVFSLVFFASSASLSAVGTFIPFINKTPWTLIMWQPHSCETLNKNGFQMTDGVRYTLGTSMPLELNRSIPIFIKNMNVWHQIDISDAGYKLIEALCVGDTILINGVSSEASLFPRLLLSIRI